MIQVIVRKIKTIIHEPKVVFLKALYFFSPLINDIPYLKMMFPIRTGYKLNLDHPKTYNEKLQWIKLYVRNPEMTLMVDKYEAKKFAGKIIGEEYIIENYGVWNSFEDIDFDSLPSKFVLKTTHDQGGIVIVPDKKKLNKKEAKKKLNKHLKLKHYYLTREWPYKDVKPRIIAEKLLEDGTNNQPIDYKYYCFNGEPKAVLIATERDTGNPKFNYFDIDYNELDFEQGGKRSRNTLQIPKSHLEMIKLSKKLSKEYPHVRVDFYEIKEKPLFGEFTFFDAGGMGRFEPFEWDRIWGDWIDLSKFQENQKMNL